MSFHVVNSISISTAASPMRKPMSWTRALSGRPAGPDYRALPAQLRQWHILSLRALDARLRGESYRAIAEVVLGFRGTKEDFEVDARKNKARRLVAHGIKMMRGGYRLLLHYPIKAPGK